MESTIHHLNSKEFEDTSYKERLKELSLLS